MWVRKSPVEIEQLQRRQKFSPLGALAITTFVMLLVLLFESGRSSPLSNPVPYIVTFLLCFLLLYVSHVMVGRYLLPLPGPTYNAPRALNQTMICPDCRKTQLDTESHLCDCGGQLEPFEYWRWVEDGNVADPKAKRGP